MLGRRIRAALRALVDQDQAKAVRERIQVVSEHVMVQAGPAVQHEDRVPVASLEDVQPCVVDPDVPATGLIHRAGPSRSAR